MVLLYRHASILSRMGPFSMIGLVLLLSVSVGVHGLSHVGLESMVTVRCLEGSVGSLFEPCVGAETA